MKKTTKAQLQQSQLLSDWWMRFSTAKDQFKRKEITGDELKQLIAVLEAECLLKFGNTEILYNYLTLKS